MVDNRLNFHSYIFKVIEAVSLRGTCLRQRFSAVIVKDNNIISTGYNGAPSKCQHCIEIGCLREKLKIPSGERHEICRGAHSEVNAIVQAAKHGVSTKGAILYTQSVPCGYCAKAVINSGISKVVCLNRNYPDKLGEELLKESGVEIKILNIKDLK